MEVVELIDIISRGEDSKHQFKKNVSNDDSLAADMVAFSNGEGGIMFIGVDDGGGITGINADDVRRINQLILEHLCTRKHYGYLLLLFASQIGIFNS